MIFDGKIIISDMDGTLLDDEKNLSEKNIEAIKYFVENGGKFSIASGRIQSRVMMYLEKMPVNLPVIAVNGMVLYDAKKREVILSDYLTGNPKGLLNGVLKKYPDVGAEIFKGEEIFFVNSNKYIEKHVSYEGFNLVITTSDKVDYPWNKLLFATDRDFEKILNEEFSEYFSDLCCVRSDAAYYDVMRKGVSKGSMLKKLCEHENIDINNVIAVGDNMNDYEFLKCAGTAAAPVSAHPEIKGIADIILKDNNDSAIADLIEKIS